MDSKISLQELAQGLAVRKHISKKDAESFVRNVFDIVEEYLIDEGQVKIKGLGTFKVVTVDSRESVNVNTGERFVIESHSKVTFTPDPVLRDQVNKPFADFMTVILNDGTSTEEMEYIAPQKEEAEPEEEGLDTLASQPIDAEQDANRPSGANVIEPVLATPVVQEDDKEECALTEEEKPAEENVLTAHVTEQSAAEEEAVIPDIAETPKEETEPEPEVEVPRDEDVPSESVVPEEIQAESLPNEVEQPEETEEEVVDITEEAIGNNEEVPCVDEPKESPLPLNEEEPKALDEEGQTEEIHDESPETQEQKEIVASGAPMAALATSTPAEECKEEGGEREIVTTSTAPMTQAEIEKIVALAVEKEMVKRQGGKSSWWKVAASFLGILLLVGGAYYLGHQTAKEVNPASQEVTVAPAAASTSTSITESAEPKSEETVEPETATPEPSAEELAKQYPQVEGGEYWMVGVQSEHVMRVGDNLSKLARKTYGDRELVQYIVTFNNIPDPNNVVLGTRIKLPVLKKK